MFTCAICIFLLKLASRKFIYCNAKSLSFPNLLNRLFTIDVAKKVYMKTLQVTGELFDHLTCWDVLRTALPAGTVSGAPKVQLIPSTPLC